LKISGAELLTLADGRNIDGVPHVKINSKYTFSKAGLDNQLQSTRLEIN